MSGAWVGGSSRRYRRLRASVLRRDGNRCRFADVIAGTYMPHLQPWAHTLKLSPRCTGLDPRNLHAHHVLGKAHGDDPYWMLTGCAACNLATGNPLTATAPQARGVTRW